MIRSGFAVTLYTFRSNPVGTVALVAFSLFFAVVPSAQVFLMATLLSQLGAPNVEFRKIVITLVLIVILVGLTGPLRSVRDFVAELVQLDVGASMQGRLADIASELTPAEIATSDVDSQIEGHSRAIVDRVSRTFGDTLLAVESILGAIGIVLTLSTYSWLASAFVAVSILPTLAMGFYLSRTQMSVWLRLGRIYRRERYIREALSSRAALLELGAFGTMSRIGQLEKDAQAQICAVRKEPVYAGLRATAWAAGLSAVLFALALYSVFSDVGFEVAAVAAVYGVLGAVNAVTQGGSQLAALVQYAPTVHALVTFFARPRAESSEPEGWDGADIRELEMFNVDVSYGDDKLAVRGASIHVARGEMIAIVGANGAGKTTLLNALLGLVPMDDGKVLANGNEVRPAAQEWWLREFGSMAQDYGKYEVTVEESVRLGRPDTCSTEAVQSALSAARASDFVDNLHQGVHTQLGEVWGGTGLSGGQWQRLALARIYLRDANVWILDEPSSAIDAETEVALFDNLRETSANRSTIIVSHRAWTLRGMDRIYVMSEGRIVEQGGFEELVERSGHFARLFREQTRADAAIE